MSRHRVSSVGVVFMKVQFNRSALADALSMITAVVPARTPKPILRCLRLSASGQEVRISATDLEVALTVLVSGASVEGDGDVVLDADRLARIVRESADEVLVLECAEEVCEITGRDSHFTVFTQKLELFPGIAGYEGEPDLEIRLDELQTATRQVVFATAKESSRYAINGVLWEVKGRKMLLVATDGRRLARSRVSLVSQPKPEVAKQRLIVPAKTMGLLERIGLGDEEVVCARLAGSQLILRCSHVVMSSNLVEGSFPKYEDIIPGDYETKLTLNTEAVLSAVRRASLLVSEDSKGIKITISPEAMVFSARAPETGAAEIQMPVAYTGTPMSIGFNPQFLCDALRVLQTPEFELQLGQPDRPGVIKGEPDFLYVLMPINLG